jgi:hypothetical protein
LSARTPIGLSECENKKHGQAKWKKIKKKKTFEKNIAHVKNQDVSKMGTLQGSPKSASYFHTQGRCLFFLNWVSASLFAWIFFLFEKGETKKKNREKNQTTCKTEFLQHWICLNPFNKYRCSVCLQVAI